MAVCGLRTLLLAVCILELIVTIQRQVFDFLGYMWLPIIANFTNIILIIFGSFGAVQYIVKYLFAYAVWSIVWLSWNIFLVCFYLDLGTLKKESDLLSLGTGSVSWWEGNGWGCQPEWGETDGLGSLRPERVEGCLLQWHHVELAQSVIAALLTLAALPLTLLSACHASKRKNNSTDKKTLPRRPVYTIELSPTETTVSETSLKPMTPRRVKRRSGSRGNNSSVRRSRRSYRNAGYHASTTSLPRDSRPSRPTSAHSSYSNFHAARPASYHVPERDTLHRSRDLYNPSPPVETVPIDTGYVGVRCVPNPGYDVAGPYADSGRSLEGRSDLYADTGRSLESRGGAYADTGRSLDGRGGLYGDTGRNLEGRGGLYGDTGRSLEGRGGPWESPPPPAPPYSPRATPQAPGPPAYQTHYDNYNMLS